MQLFTNNSWLRFLFPSLLILTALAFAQTSAIKSEVKTLYVGVYNYAPYAVADEQGNYQGLTPDLISLLNRHQTQYHFEIYPVSPKRRYQAFANAQYDMIFFENPDWGWESTDFLSTAAFHSDGDIYVALADKDRDQHFFDDLKALKILGISGFHYGFAGFNADEDYLHQNFNILLSWSNERNLELLCERNGDVAVMGKAYLRDFFIHHPDMSKDFLLSERYDQRFHHYILLRPKAGIDLAIMERLLGELRSNGELGELFSRYGVPACSDNLLTQAGQMQDACLF